ncbi:MAG: hypothetical protein NTY77_06590 [Elusimicrobia bacterium]|nr:hypothetical protein [Elusimicrobiota bacterium]
MPSGADARPGLLLVELMPDEPERQFRTSSYPFLLGLARALRWRASWCALGVRYDPALRYALGPQDLGLLRAEVARRRPRVVVINERLRADQWAALQAASPDARLVYCDIDEGLNMLGRFAAREVFRTAGPRLQEPGLLERLTPSFARLVLNGAPWAAQPLIRVVTGTRCSYRSRVAENRFYRRLGLPMPAMSCAFCQAGSIPVEKYVADEAAFAARVVAAAVRSRSRCAAETHFEFIGCGLWRRCDELIAALLRLGVRGAELSFMPRIDEFLAKRAALARLLPRLARHGLALRLYGMGVENFSPAENLRLNKGITADQVHEAADFIVRATARWPGQFRYPNRHFSMILFTPWTSLQDLRLNLAGISRCPLVDHAAALRGRLQLFPGRPITRLAEKDGLVARKGAERFYNSGCITQADQGEVPWRFAHPEVGVLWQLARRLSIDRARLSAAGLSYDGLPADEPAARAVAALLEDGPPDPMPLFARAVKIVARRPRIASLAELLPALRARGAART